MADGTVLIVGGTGGLGREVAAHYADQGREVIITGRDPAKTREVAADLGSNTGSIAFDLAQPETIAAALSEVGNVDKLVLSAIARDNNPVRDYDVGGAVMLATMKLVGYTEVIHTLLPRLSDDSSVVLFGGRAKDRPYPGSTTVTAVNGAVSSMITTFAIELAPIRFNAIHPGIVGDSPFWEGKPAALEAVVERTPTRASRHDGRRRRCHGLPTREPVGERDQPLCGQWLAAHVAGSGCSDMTEELDGIGDRLRDERTKAGISQRELARRLGLSASLISQLESGLSKPSVGTLYAIVTELDLSLDKLLRGDDDPRRDDGGSGSFESNGRVSPLVHPEERKTIDLASGVRWEQLTADTEEGVDFLHAIYEVGGASTPDESLMRHHGREYGYVISGKMGIQLGFDLFELEPGDSIAFESTQPHRLFNRGDEPVHAIWFVVGRGADDRAHGD